MKPAEKHLELHTNLQCFMFTWHAYL